VTSAIVDSSRGRPPSWPRTRRRCGKNYVSANRTFTASSMALSGNTISVTLGTPSGAISTVTGTSTLQWVTSSAATDLAGNPLVSATIAESGAADLDF
jgi:hypothetical protein